jgi:hypothetical protein
MAGLLTSPGSRVSPSESPLLSKPLVADATTIECRASTDTTTEYYFARSQPQLCNRGKALHNAPKYARILVDLALLREFLVRGRKSLAAFGPIDVLSCSADGKSASARRPPFGLEIHFALPHRSLRTSRSSASNYENRTRIKRPASFAHNRWHMHCLIIAKG